MAVSATATCPNYEELEHIAAHILGRTKHRPQLGIVCGSGLGGLAEVVDDTEVLPYADIPGFPVSTVPGHQGKLVFGILCGKCVVLMHGRFHHYEGYPMWKTTIPFRVMKLLGVSHLVLTNAAGGLNPDFHVGDIMIIRDHIDLPGLTGEFGPRFLPTVGTYDKTLADIVKVAAVDLGLSDLIQEGVYIMIGGPTFETVAESKLLHNFGADAVEKSCACYIECSRVSSSCGLDVCDTSDACQFGTAYSILRLAASVMLKTQGHNKKTSLKHHVPSNRMSTVAEAVVARHMDMKVVGISIITDMCSLSYADSSSTTHEQVLEICRKRTLDMQKLVSLVVERISV